MRKLAIFPTALSCLLPCFVRSEIVSAQDRAHPTAEAMSPVESLQAIQVRPGFEVELVVSEPMVLDPTDINWGPDGRLWVAEMADYPMGVDGQGTPGGRIRFLEDQDRDGKYDRSQVFLDGVPFPTSVSPWRSGVLVTAAPEIFYAEDQDGDGRADTKEVLYSGFREGNQQHRVNGLEWGLDNWLYVANGDSGGKILSHKTGKTLTLRGRDLRIRPDTGELELQAGQTQYGRNRDDWGNWLGCNSAVTWHFALADHYLRRNPYVAAPSPRRNLAGGLVEVFPLSDVFSFYSEYEKPDPGAPHLVTAGCGIIFYRDDLFGEAFSRSVFYSAAVHNLVHRFDIEPDGVTFRRRRARGEERSEFLASRDNWFRPLTVRTGPDGAVWIADMYRRVMEHPEWIDDDVKKQVNVRDGDDRGRIYRVYPANTRPRPIPRLAELEDHELVSALDSPNGWQRDLAQQMLLWRGARSMASRLVALSMHSQRPQARLQALCTLDGLGILESTTLSLRLRDEHPGVRRHAVRLAERFLVTNAAISSAALGLQKDSDPHVRMQLAYSLGEWRDPRAGQALARLASNHADDPYFVAAALSSALPHIDALVLETLPQRGRELNAIQSPLFDQILRLVGTEIGKPHAPAVLEAITSKPEQTAFAPWQFDTAARLLAVFEEAGLSLPQVIDAAADRQQLGHQLSELLAAAGMRATNAEDSVENRSAALRLLGRDPRRRETDLEIISAQLEPETPTELQVIAIEQLVALEDSRIPNILFDAWGSRVPRVRQVVLNTLLSRPVYVDGLLDVAAHDSSVRIGISTSQRQRLLNDPDERVRKRAQQVFGTVHSDRAEIVAKYQPSLEREGDRASGRAIFEKTCASCHALDGLGRDVGPQLLAMTDKSPASFLRHILDPNRAVELKYLQYVAVLRDGRVISGSITDETSTSVTLQGAEGEPQTLLRRQIISLKSDGKSLMPEGLEESVDVPQMTDLITFLHRTTSPLKRFSGNKPQLVSSVADGSISLTATNSSIYGPSLVFEQRFKNLGFWSSPQDRAEWTFESATKSDFDVWLEWALPEVNPDDRLRLRVAEQELVLPVPSTQAWENYRWRKFGRVTLDSGKHQLVAQSSGAVNRGALIDLRAVKLLPPGAPPPTAAGNDDPKSGDDPKSNETASGRTPVGVAKVDITPTHPTLLAGYGGRKGEHEGVDTKIWARALAIGNDPPSIVVAVDNCGVPAPVVEEVARRLTQHSGIPRERLVVCSSHTHSAPTLVDYAVVVWGGRTTEAQEERTRRYTQFVTDKIVEAASAAMRARQPCHLSWGQGRVTFGANRRILGGNAWRGFGFQGDGPVDHSLPVLVARGTDDRIRAIWTNYACHCTTVGGRNRIGGDWVGFANEFLERDHKGATALTTVGCGADIGPHPSGDLEVARDHGEAIATEVSRLFSSKSLTPLPTSIHAKMRRLRLPYAEIPKREHWENQDSGFHKYHAKLQLARLDRGEELPTHLEDYPVTTWTFGKSLAMVFLAGEVVVDYAVRLKRELDWQRLWIHGWANDVPCYTPSKRVLKEGGYEPGFSMIYYDRPTSFAPEVEEIVVSAVHSMLPATFAPPAERAPSPYHVHPVASEDYQKHLDEQTAARLQKYLRAMDEERREVWSSLLSKHRQGARNGYTQVSRNDGSEDNWFCYTGGRNERHYIRQKTQGHTLSWETSPIELDPDEESVTVVFLGGVGYTSEPPTAGFTFLVGSQEVLSFDVTLEPARWSSLDGRVELAYFPTWRSNVDSGGFFYVTVPKDSVINGKPLILGARSQGEGSLRWFAVDNFKDAKARQRVLAGSRSQ